MKKLSVFILFLHSIFIYSCSGNQNEIIVIFDRVDNLEIGSGVFKGNIEIGEVTDMDLFKNKVMVKIKLKKDFYVPLGSTFTLMPSTLVAAAIKVSYSNNPVHISKTDTSYGQQSSKLFLDNMIPDSVKQEKIRKSLDKINEGVGEFIDAVSDTARQK